MTTNTPPSGRIDRHLLTRLTRTRLAIAASDEDIRGRTARDRGGQVLGKVDDLLVDATDRHARFLRIRSGGLLGLGNEISYLPIEAVVAIDGDSVTVDAAPASADGRAYEPQLVREPDDPVERGPHDYGAYWPYWTAGYPYPRDSGRDRR